MVNSVWLLLYYIRSSTETAYKECFGTVWSDLVICHSTTWSSVCSYIR